MTYIGCHIIQSDRGRMHRTIFISVLSLLFACAHGYMDVDNISDKSVAPLAFDINQAYTQLMYAYSAYCPEVFTFNNI